MTTVSWNKLTLSVSHNGRYFVDADGDPFFWLGDTAWPLFANYSLAEAEHYLKRRTEQGFSIVKGVLAWPLGTFYEQELPQPNYRGERPWLDNDPARPNEAYFEHVEHLLRVALAHGLVLNMLPNWGYHVSDLRLINEENAHTYGLWLGERFKQYPNVIWALGGDRNPSGDEHIYRAMARGIRAGQSGNQLMTFHPPGAQSSARYFHNDDWLDFNLIQTWGELHRVYPTVISDVARTPNKPVIMDEGAYEDGPEYPLGPITPLLVRRQAWWTLMAGGYYTYGHNDMWRVEHPKWIDSLETPGAAQMGIFKAIATAFPWWDMIPCPCLIADGANSGKIVNVAMRSQDCRIGMVYFSTQCNVWVSVGEINTPEVRATWINPKDGERKEAGIFKRGNHWFTTPEFWEDAVLLLEAID